MISTTPGVILIILNAILFSVNAISGPPSVKFVEKKPLEVDDQAGKKWLPSTESDRVVSFATVSTVSKVDDLEKQTTVKPLKKEMTVSVADVRTSQPPFIDPISTTTHRSMEKKDLSRSEHHQDMLEQRVPQQSPIILHSNDKEQKMPAMLKNVNQNIGSDKPNQILVRDNSEDVLPLLLMQTKKSEDVLQESLKPSDFRLKTTEEKLENEIQIVNNTTKTNPSINLNRKKENIKLSVNEKLQQKQVVSASKQPRELNILENSQRSIGDKSVEQKNVHDTVTTRSEIAGDSGRLSENIQKDLLNTSSREDQKMVSTQQPPIKMHNLPLKERSNHENPEKLEVNEETSRNLKKEIANSQEKIVPSRIQENEFPPRDKDNNPDLSRLSKEKVDEIRSDVHGRKEEDKGQNEGPVEDERPLRTHRERSRNKDRRMMNTDGASKPRRRGSQADGTRRSRPNAKVESELGKDAALEEGSTLEQSRSMNGVESSRVSENKQHTPLEVINLPDTPVSLMNRSMTDVIDEGSPDYLGRGARAPQTPSNDDIASLVIAAQDQEEIATDVDTNRLETTDEAAASYQLMPCTCGVFLTDQFKRGDFQPRGEAAIKHQMAGVFPCTSQGRTRCINKCVEAAARHLSQSAKILCGALDRDIFKLKAYLWVKNCEDKWVNSNLSDGKEYCCKEGATFKCPVRG